MAADDQRRSRSDEFNPSPRADRPLPRRRRGVDFDQLKPRESRTRSDELEYFLVDAQCLGCRRALQARADKLYGKLRCPHCGTLMHIRADGKWYEGLPPSLDPAAARPSLGRRLASRVRLLMLRFPILRRRSPYVAAGGVLLGLLLYVALSVTGREGVELPASLEGRAIAVAQCAVQSDYGGFQELVDRSATADAHEWFVEAARFLAGLPGGVSAIDTRVVFEDAPERHACVIVTFWDSSQDEKFASSLFWVLTPENGWLLDGKRTLDDLRIAGRRSGP